jgi:peptide/nickel transport system substrate-binding protein
VLSFLYHTREGARGGWNATRYSNTELDAMIQSLASEIDPAKRGATMAKALQIARESLTHIPLHNQNIAWAMKSSFNIPVNSENNMYLKTIAAR